MYNLIELTYVQEKTTLYLNPAAIKFVKKGAEGTWVRIDGEWFVVKESPQEIKKRIDQSRLIHSDLSETLPARSLEEMTQPELDQLKTEFLGYDELLPGEAQFSNFTSIWHYFVSDRPKVSEVVRLLDQVHEWGYQIEEVDA